MVYQIALFYLKSREYQTRRPLRQLQAYLQATSTHQKTVKIMSIETNLDKHRGRDSGTPRSPTPSLPSNINAILAQQEARMEQLLDQQRAQNKRELAKEITAASKAQEARIYEEIRQQFITEHLPLVHRDLRRELAPFVMRELRIENSNPTNWDTVELQASPSSARRTTNSRTERTPSMERGGRLPRHHSTRCRLYEWPEYDASSEDSCMQFIPSSYPESATFFTTVPTQHGPNARYRNITPDAVDLESGQWSSHFTTGKDNYEYGQWLDENKDELFSRNSDGPWGEGLEWQEVMKENYDEARDLESSLGWGWRE